MPIPSKISELVERFEQHGEDYRAGKYNETQLRRDFLDPFFGLEGLGWDMDNSTKAGENVREVVQEYPLKIEGANKKPDYCFRNGNTEKFFVEAKKPSVNLKDDLRAAFQTRSYGWNKGLPFCVLTDFEEFAVYDCRFKPVNTDSAQTARTFYCKYTEYDAKWSEIEALFGREAVRGGALDKQAAQKVKKGTVSFDADFLHLIEGWREALAQNIARHNKGISQADLNYAVQMTIDRILFLRICEDRDIEPYGQLQNISGKKGVYGELGELFRQADNRYNSGLFHFGKEKARPGEGDSLTLNLKIDDSVLHSIVYKLYPPQPYNFRLVPVEILGQVYEQFLGKVIRLEKSSALIEDKPEVRKAGGVFYTPSYIVDYIVRQTLGPLCEGKTPKEVGELKVLDPACGSGSFLIGAYDFLLNWHLDYYTQNAPEKLAARREGPICRETKDQAEGAAPLWRLTVKEKKRILLNNIYGVDIDRQAVEVTKLSLLLKVLEDGTPERAPTPQSRLLPSQERLLPDLDANIKCGNSLIGHDFYDEKGWDTYSKAEQERINAFDWKDKELGFYSILKNGGFDAIIGNPPYGFHQIHTQDSKDYFKKHYAASEGSFENYFLFYEASLKLLRPAGYHGYIVPVTWLTIPSAVSLRRFVLSNFAVRSIAWLPELVFKDAQVNTLVSIIQHSEAHTVKILISDQNDPSKNSGAKGEIEQSKFIDSDYTIFLFENSVDTELLKRIDSFSVPMSSLARPCSGYNPYEVGKGIAPAGTVHTIETVVEKPYHSPSKLGSEWKTEAVGRDLGRYSLKWPQKRFIKYGPWLSAPRDPSNFLGSRLLVQEITGGNDRRIVATFCDQELYHSRDIIPIKCDNECPSPFYLLGILNSWLMTWRHHRRSPKAKKALFPKVLVSDLKNIPIRAIDFADKSDKARHDEMVKLVERMLDLHKQLATARTAPETTALQRQISATDKQIDKLVYALYELTDDEIALVEGA